VAEPALRAAHGLLLGLHELQTLKLLAHGEYETKDYVGRHDDYVRPG
jgi:hypothetical protein